MNLINEYFISTKSPKIVINMLQIVAITPFERDTHAVL